MKTKMVQVPVSEVEFQVIRLLAAQKDCSMAQVVREAINPTLAPCIANGKIKLPPSINEMQAARVAKAMRDLPAELF